MSIVNQIVTDALRVVQEKQRIYEALVKRVPYLPFNPFNGYADAITTLSTINIPTIVTSMSVTAETEPLTGNIWYVKPGGTGSKNGTTWSNSFATRQEAVNAASSGDQIRVWEGRYYLEQVQTPKAGVSEYYGFNDDGSWLKRQPFTHPSIHDAQFTTNNFTNENQNFTTGQVIDGLWIQNVRRSSSGAGLFLNAKSYLKNCTIIYNTTTTEGGGACVKANSIISNSLIANNTASSIGGGAYVTNGGKLSKCFIVNNSSNNAGGGAYVNSYSSQIDSCTFINCSATGNGGGVFSSSSAFVTTNCVFLNCVASSGGGLALDWGVTATNCSSINCSSTGSGGGFRVGIQQAVTITNCTSLFCKAASGTGNGFLVTAGTGQRLYNCCSWNDDIHMLSPSFAYKLYNCASNLPLTGVTGWDTIADVRDFVTLTDFPFTKQGVAPFDVPGVFNTVKDIGQSDNALQYIDDFILPKLSDQHISANVPLIGAGYYEAGVTPDTDADGIERPYPPSIGAYEYHAE